jgi:Zn-finger nucleic acid-binding protein
MPGIGQVWLTRGELEALIQASINKSTVLSPRYQASLVPKLIEARDALGCPVPPRQKEES